MIIHENTKRIEIDGWMEGWMDVYMRLVGEGEWVDREIKRMALRTILESELTYLLTRMEMKC